jgi:hypothetical protein
MASLAFLPKLNEVTLHTSNLINWSNMRHKPPVSTTHELVEYSKLVLNCWKKKQYDQNLQYVDKLEIECKAHKDIISPEERENIRVTAKICLLTWSIDDFTDAFNNALNYINVTDIDTLLISFPKTTGNSENGLNHTNGIFIPESSDLPMTSFSIAVLKIWKEVERLSHEFKALRLGVCDFPLDELKILHHYAQVKPTINQLFIHNSCHIPEDLSTFARDHEIQLLVHHDGHDVLPTADAQAIFADVFSPRDGLLWEPNWVVCYHSLFKMQGIIRAKGYIFKLRRDINKLPYC